MTTSPEGGISGHSWPFSLSIADHPPSHRYRPERRRIQATGSGQLGKNPRFYAEIGYTVDRNGGREDESLPPAHERLERPNAQQFYRTARPPPTRHGSHLL